MSAQPNPALQVLPMDPDYLPQVLAIESRAYVFPWSETIFRDCLKAGYGAWVLADQAGFIHGYAMMSMAVGEAHVLNLCIDPSQQQRGLGRILLQHLMTIARAAYMTVVLLEVRKSNRGAIRLYENAGFQRLGLRKGYYPDTGGREDALVLGFEIV